MPQRRQSKVSCCVPALPTMSTLNFEQYVPRTSAPRQPPTCAKCSRQDELKTDYLPIVLSQHHQLQSTCYLFLHRQAAFRVDSCRLILHSSSLLQFTATHARQRKRSPNHPKSTRLSLTFSNTCAPGQLPRKGPIILLGLITTGHTAHEIYQDSAPWRSLRKYRGANLYPSPLKNLF